MEDLEGCEENNKDIDLTETGCEDERWTELGQDRLHCG
jgi:hypothetical protein